MAFLLVLTFLLAFILAAFSIRNTDVFQQLAVGRLIANGEYSFGQDPISWTSQPVSWANSLTGEKIVWVNHAWLFGLGTYGLYRLDESGAVLVTCKALLVVVTVGFAGADRTARGPPSLRADPRRWPGSAGHEPPLVPPADRRVHGCCWLLPSTSWNDPVCSGKPTPPRQARPRGGSCPWCSRCGSTWTSGFCLVRLWWPCILSAACSRPASAHLPHRQTCRCRRLWPWFLLVSVLPVWLILTTSMPLSYPNN